MRPIGRTRTLYHFNFSRFEHCRMRSGAACYGTTRAHSKATLLEVAKRKASSAGEGRLPDPPGGSGPEIEPDRRMVPLFRRQVRLDRGQLPVQRIANRLDADIARERRLAQRVA